MQVAIFQGLSLSFILLQDVSISWLEGETTEIQLANKA